MKLERLLRRKTLCVAFALFSIGAFFVLLNFNPAQATTQQTDITVSIDSAIALSLTNCDSTDSSVLKIDVEPTPAGTFKSNCQTVNVQTNAPGYTLTARSSSSTLNYLNPTTVSPTPTIATTSNLLLTPSTLTNNTWGFATEGRLSFDATYIVDNSSNTYAQLPTTDTTIYTTDQFPLPETNHEFFYGANLTTDTMAGTYSTTVTYTAVGAEVPEPILYPKVGNGITFQETTYFINESCSSLPIYDSSNPDPASTVIMTDTRNNQDYRVRRLQDGKCWMIDNLKLATPGTALTLTSEDTNIPEGTTFTIPANAITTAANRATNGVCIDETISGTTGYLSCDGTNTQSATNNTFIAYADPSNTANCLNNTTTNGDTVVYNTDSLTKCGYLYNWYTATAGTGAYDLTSGDGATASICPAGWRLPSVESPTVLGLNEFGLLNNAMAGLSSSSIISDATTYPNWRPSGPFSGTYSGQWGNSFSSLGLAAAYWSSSSGSSTYARGLYIGYSNVSPGSVNIGKIDGRLVRCII